VPYLGPPIEQPPRAVIFDVGRVIIPVNLSRSMEALGTPCGLTHLQVLRQLEADPHWHDWQEGRISPRDWHKHLSEKLHFSYGFDEFCAIWNGVLGTQTILPDQLFERLAARCRLALLSNTDPIHVAHFEANYPFVRSFHARAYSCRVGSCKPSALIYHHALREVGAMADESLFIDDLREDVLAAASLGIYAFHFTSAEDLLAEFARLNLWTI
jgi:glucose-1-phosphatase